MQSSNPVFRVRRVSTVGDRPAPTEQATPGDRISYPEYATSTQAPPTYVDQGPMTIDSVVQKTGITLGLTSSSRR